jgi:hypothetical protein
LWNAWSWRVICINFARYIKIYHITISMYKNNIKDNGNILNYKFRAGQMRHGLHWVGIQTAMCKYDPVHIVCSILHCNNSVHYAYFVYLIEPAMLFVPAKSYDLWLCQWQ